MKECTSWLNHWMSVCKRRFLWPPTAEPTISASNLTVPAICPPSVFRIPKTPPRVGGRSGQTKPGRPRLRFCPPEKTSKTWISTTPSAATIRHGNLCAFITTAPAPSSKCRRLYPKGKLRPCWSSATAKTPWSITGFTKTATSLTACLTKPS